MAQMMEEKTYEPSRAKRLKAATHAIHERLDNSIMAAASFGNLEGYGRFLQLQYAFHREIAPLYDEPSLKGLLPGLAGRRRLELVEADLADLALAHPEASRSSAFTAGRPIDVPTALGWLYVAEGSNMGAALLRKQAADLGLSDSHGARHLAPGEGGPAAHWRAFTSALDAIQLNAEEELRVVGGAAAAFVFVQALADVQLG